LFISSGELMHPVGAQYPETQPPKAATV